jgi:hypothetical protein
MRTNELEERCTNTCDAERNAENAMGNTIAGAKSRPGRALKNVQKPLSGENVW